MSTLRTEKRRFFQKGIVRDLTWSEMPTGGGCKIRGHHLWLVPLSSLVRLPFLARPAVATAEEMGLTGWPRPPEYEEDMRGHNHVAHALRFRTVMHPREGGRGREGESILADPKIARVEEARYSSSLSVRPLRVG